MKRASAWICLCVLLFFTGGWSQTVAPQKYWIYFRDRGPSTARWGIPPYREAAQRLSERAVQRRLKVRPPERLIDEHDLPLFEGYLHTLKQLGVQPVVHSRWLNAISAYLPARQKAEIAALPFVKKVVPVRRLAVPPSPEVHDQPLPRRSQPADHRFDYGLSLTQNELVNVPVLHDAGIYGKGVLVGMLDTGFNVSEHPAFQRLQVLGQFDFVFGDSITADEPGKDVKGAQNHGTQTLSVIAGFDPGNLIGPAFAAGYFLSKTEDIRSETPVEEDFWMAGIEWMEAQGIDVASSSLGYRDFDNPADNHEYQDLDGETTVVTRAAQLAAERGVVVVNSAGNEGGTAWQYIIAPADGKDVIAVGAVTASGRRASFSSIGPTYDGRIKPDVMAMGVAVRAVRLDPQFPYAGVNGTSFSCPMVAGIVAQMLSAHPYLTPRQVIEALQRTASQADSPDNFMGYGIVDARKAITYWGPAFSNDIDVHAVAAGRLQMEVRVLTAAPLDRASLFWRRGGETTFQQVAMSLADSTLLRSDPIPYRSGTRIEFYFLVEIQGQDRFTYPHGAPISVFTLGENGDVEPPAQLPETYSLSAVYPNPMVLSSGQITKIELGAAQPAEVDIYVYNLLGQRVAEVVRGKHVNAGFVTIEWKAFQSGLPVAAGIYILQARFRQEDGTTVLKQKKLTILGRR